MSAIIGYSLDKNIAENIKSIRVGISQTFTDLGLKVSWKDQKSYNITVAYLGESLNLIQRAYINHKLKDFQFESFPITFSTIKIGKSGRNRSSIFLEILDGGEDIRKLCLELRQTLHLKEDINLVPQVTLGRITSDLSDSMYTDLQKSLYVMSKKLPVKKIKFVLDDVSIIEEK
ncbi:hypothetical protein J6Z48_02460 [bacterium]|nr:hypothetical protein [bacterium]